MPWPEETKGQADCSRSKSTNTMCIIPAIPTFKAILGLCPWIGLTNIQVCLLIRMPMIKGCTWLHSESDGRETVAVYTIWLYSALSSIWLASSSPARINPQRHRGTWGSSLPWQLTWDFDNCMYSPYLITATCPSFLVTRGTRGRTNQDPCCCAIYHNQYYLHVRVS